MAHWTSFVTAIQEACTVALSDVNDVLNPAVAKIMYLSSWPSALLATHEGLCVHSPDPLLEALLFKNYAWEKKCVIHSDTQRGPTNGYYNFNLETEEAKNLTLRDFMEYVCFVMQELEEEPDGLQYPQWKYHPLLRFAGVDLHVGKDVELTMKWAEVQCHDCRDWTRRLYWDPPLEE
ncbi:hypothetical protein MVEN_00070500 [Mycena venus]|uniref:Uncharacterized protein n=1 Tax=Mycena venus TaxID=2733690 RepID=A0A8H7DGC4_9AGAR|nr:hypothetical protein MVEN_00070500 [Mycena venus]